MMHKKGYRGYITARVVNGSIIPQRVQNLVVRDYAQARGLAFRLSVVELIMPGSAMILNGALNDLPALEGVILYSLHTLPMNKARRTDIYARILGEGCSLHAALEGLAINEESDIARFEDILDVHAILPYCVSGWI